MPCVMQCEAGKGDYQEAQVKIHLFALPSLSLFSVFLLYLLVVVVCTRFRGLSSSNSDFQWENQSRNTMFSGAFWWKVHVGFQQSDGIFLLLSFQ